MNSMFGGSVRPVAMLTKSDSTLAMTDTNPSDDSGTSGRPRRQSPWRARRTVQARSVTHFDGAPCFSIGTVVFPV